MTPDWLVIGAGFAGTTVARMLADDDQSVLIADRRMHIGGNAYDEYDDHGVLIHRYGAHIFHTNSDEVIRFLSRFTAWRPYEHRVLASVQGQLLPIPINIDTVNRLYGLSLDTETFPAWLAFRAEPRDRIENAEDAVVAKMGRDLYDQFFRGYTRKQWGVDATALGAQVTARIPVRMNHDDRYFTDRYQMIPRDGYAAMFCRMLDHRKIQVLLGADAREVYPVVQPRQGTIVTGPIDEYFDHQLGRLPYRSLTFEYESHPVETMLPAATVNYPNAYDYTRVLEFKQITGQVHPWTTLAYEYPTGDGDPYYPVPAPENDTLYQSYKELASTVPNVWFTGRLGSYRYYNMDQVVAQSMKLAKTLRSSVLAAVAD